MSLFLFGNIFASDSKITPDTSKTSDEIFDVVEELPEYPGGLEAMYKFLNDNMKYPKKARKKRIQGKVYVQFVVDRDGSITNVEVLRGIGYGCDAEAVRVVKLMPKWKSGKQRGKFVKVRYKLPITFKLTEKVNEK